jgi:hypothetical protein
MGSSVEKRADLVYETLPQSVGQETVHVLIRFTLLGYVFFLGRLWQANRAQM